VLMPRINATADGTSLEWKNDSMICYSPAELPPIDGKKRWSANMQLLGMVSGGVFNAWCGWCATYSARNPGYQMWDVMDRTDVQLAMHYLAGCKCDEFVEASLWELYRLGARLDTDATLFKNSIPFLTKRPPRALDMSDPTDATFVVRFYAHLGALGKSLGGDDAAAADGGGGMSLPTLLRTIATSLDEWLVFERRTSTYYRVKLSPPYIAMDKLYQPMALPWQQGARFDGFETPVGNFGAGAMLSGIASHTAGLLKERLPRVALSERQRLLIRLGAAAALLLTVSVPVGLYWHARAAMAAARQQALGSIGWYALGVVNGALALPLVLLEVGERKFREKQS